MVTKEKHADRLLRDAIFRLTLKYKKEGKTEIIAHYLAVKEIFNSLCNTTQESVSNETLR